VDTASRQGALFTQLVRAAVDLLGMVAPRQIVPGRTYLVTRRCTQRQYLLRPDSLTNVIFLYCLAEAALRFRVQVLGWTAVSNHYHAVVYDPEGRLPDFLAHFHKMTAKALNARWSRRENLWAAEPASVVRLVEPGDVLDRVVYTLANPVADDLVDRVLNWPGASSLPCMDGRTLTLKRPRTFFRRRGSMPESVTLRLATPEGWQDRPHEWFLLVRNGVAAREHAASMARVEAGRRIVGRRALLRMSHERRAETFEPRRTLRPHLACADPLRRRRELDAIRSFRAAHANARRQIAAGDPGVVLPYGTFRLARWLPFLTMRDEPAASSRSPSLL
jgi:putative transposase